MVLVEDFLTTFSPFLHGEGFIEDEAEDEVGSCEVRHGQLLCSEHVSLMSVKILVDEVSNGLNSGVVGLVSVGVELLAHNERDNLHLLVADVVAGGVDGPHLLGLFSVEAVLLGEHAEDGLGLVHYFAAFFPNGDLASGHGGFQGSPLFESDPLVLIINLSVSKEHSDWFSTTVDTEVGKFSHK